MALAFLFSSGFVVFVFALIFNAVLVAMAFDGFLSRNFWVGVPSTLWLGGYMIAAIFSHLEVAFIRKEAERINSHAPAKWDRSTQPLEIDVDYRGKLTSRSDLNAYNFILKYGIDEVFSGGIDNPYFPLHRTHLVHEACPGSMSMAGVNDDSWEEIQRGNYPDLQFAQNVCLLNEPSRSVTSALKVTAGPVRELGGLVRGVTQDITISGPNQAIFTVRRLQVVPLPWLPFMFRSCKVEEHAYPYKTSRHCTWGAGIPSWDEQKDQSPDAVVARALALKPIPIEERLPGAVWAARSRRYLKPDCPQSKGGAGSGGRSAGTARPAPPPDKPAAAQCKQAQHAGFRDVSATRCSVGGRAGGAAS